MWVEIKMEACRCGVLILLFSFSLLYTHFNRLHYKKCILILGQKKNKHDVDVNSSGLGRVLFFR